MEERNRAEDDVLRADPGGGDDAVGLYPQLPMSARYALGTPRRPGRVLEDHIRFRGAGVVDGRVVVVDQPLDRDGVRGGLARADDLNVVVPARDDPAARVQGVRVRDDRPDARLTEVEVELRLLELRVERHDHTAQSRHRKERHSEVGDVREYERDGVAGPEPHRRQTVREPIGALADVGPAEPLPPVHEGAAPPAGLGCRVEHRRDRGRPGLGLQLVSSHRWARPP